MSSVGVGEGVGWPSTDVMMAGGDGAASTRAQRPAAWQHGARRPVESGKLGHVSQPSQCAAVGGRPPRGSSGNNFWAGNEGTESERHGNGMTMRGSAARMARRHARSLWEGAWELESA